MIKAVEIVPGNREIVHHALIYVDPTATSVTDTVGGDCGGLVHKVLIWLWGTHLVAHTNVTVNESTKTWNEHAGKQSSGVCYALQKVDLMKTIVLRLSFILPSWRTGNKRGLCKIPSYKASCSPCLQNSIHKFLPNTRLLVGYQQMFLF